MPPDIYTPVRKPWGTSTVCYRDESIEVAKIVVLPGGFCSRHLHRRKSNQFIVVKGELTIECYAFDGKVESFQIGFGVADYAIDIQPGQQHRFRSPRWGAFNANSASCGGAVAYEIYTASPGEKIDPDDIERFDEGGRE